MTSSNATRWHHSSGFSMPLLQVWTHAEPEDPLVAVIAIEPLADGIVTGDTAEDLGDKLSFWN